MFLIPCLFAIGADIRRRRPEWFVRTVVPGTWNVEIAVSRSGQNAGTAKFSLVAK